MITLKLQAKKAELARRILNTDNEELIDKLSGLYDKLSIEKYPCDYTIEEVAQACEDSIQQYKKGEIIPDSEIKRKTL